MEYSLSIKKRIWNVFQKEKLSLLGILDQIATLQDRNSDDRERYLKMGLRLDPKSAYMNFRNEKDIIILLIRNTLDNPSFDLKNAFLNENSFYQSKIWKLVSR